MERILFWTPRVLAILTILFTGLFALDIFALGLSIRETILGLLIHLIPSFALIVALIIGWRRKRVGGILFIVLAAAGFILWGFRSWPVTTPPILVGILFLVHGLLYGKNPQAAP